jgi:hypothetical protein
VQVYLTRNVNLPLYGFPYSSLLFIHASFSLPPFPIGKLRLLPPRVLPSRYQSIRFATLYKIVLI